MRLRKVKLLYTDGIGLQYYYCWKHSNLWRVPYIFSKKGYFVTGLQCSSKLRSLKKTFKAIKDHNSKSGNGRRTWQFLEKMEEIFEKKAWCNPVAVASSTGFTSRELAIDDGGLRMGESGSERLSKSNKTKLISVIQKKCSKKKNMRQRKLKDTSREWKWIKNSLMSLRK